MRLSSARSVIACLPLMLALGIAGCDKAKPVPSQPDASANAGANVATPAPAAFSGPGAEPNTLDRGHKGLALPAMPFAAPGGGPATFGAFRGRPLLVNLWATWCGPCVKELPSLDALALREAGRLAVVAISEDQGGDAQVGPFWRAHGIKALTAYADAHMKLATPLEVDGLPTTILFDAKGREVWRVVGGKDWTGAEAAGLLAEAK